MKRLLALSILATLMLSGITTAGAAPPRSATPLRITAAGTYHVRDARGRMETIKVTDSGPIRHVATKRRAAFWCRTVSYDRDWDATTYDYLQTGLCWNGTQASAYGVVSTCQTGALPSGVCFNNWHGIACNWCASVMAWGNYNQNTDWFIGDNAGLALSGDKNGKWWPDAWSRP